VYLLTLDCPEADASWWRPQKHVPVAGSINIVHNARAFKQPVNAALIKMLQDKDLAAGCGRA